MNEETLKIVEDIKAGMLKADDVKKLIADGNFASSEEVNAIKAAAEEIGLELKKMRDQSPKVEKSFREILEDAQKEMQEAFASKRGYSLTLKTDVLTSSITTDKAGFMIPGFNPAAYAGTKLRTVFPRVSVGADAHNQIFYTDQTTTTRNADVKGEGGGAPESAIAWTGRVLNLMEIKDSIPVSRKAMNHISQLEATIKDFIMTNLMLKENTQLWSGDGSAPDMTGVYTTATAFNAGTYSGVTVVDATLNDLIAVLRVQIANGKESKYMPTHVIMNPADILRMKLAKGTDGHYVIPPFTTEGGMVVDSVIVVEDAVVTANTLVIGDFRHAKVYMGEDITLEWGYTDTQFVEGLITLYGHMDEALLIKTIDAGAFLKVTDIDAAITAITATT